MIVYMIKIHTYEFNDASISKGDAGWDENEKFMQRVFATRAAAQKVVTALVPEEYQSRPEDRTPQFKIVSITLEGTSLSEGGIFFEEKE